MLLYDGVLERTMLEYFVTVVEKKRVINNNNI